jgi:hypothetical protein
MIPEAATAFAARWPEACTPEPEAPRMRCADDGATMLTALILVCLLAQTTDLRDCTADNAIAVIRVPEAFGNPATCLMHGQAYLAHTAIAQDFGQDERVRIVCARSDKMHAGHAAPTLN